MLVTEASIKKSNKKRYQIITDKKKKVIRTNINENV